MLAAILCATDTVAALTIVKEKSYPILNSILFGEGVVNDAVSILLFRAVEQLIKEERSSKQFGDDDSLHLTVSDVGLMFLNFAVLSFCSIFTGIFFGLLTAFILKNLQHLDRHPVREIFLLMLTAYLSYIFSEMCGFSGIMTLFSCGFTMSNYAYQNLSKKSKIGSGLAIETIGHGAEAFVFTYLGLSVYGIEESRFSSSFTLALIFSGIVARAVGVFVPAFIVGLSKCFHIGISMKQLVLIWFSGIIRGAIAFALSLSVKGELAQGKSLLVSSTLVVVLVTTVIFGGLMQIFAKFIGLKEEVTPYEGLMQEEGNQNKQVRRKLSENKGQPSMFLRLWQDLDYRYLKPIFIKESELRREEEEEEEMEVEIDETPSEAEAEKAQKRNDKQMKEPGLMSY